MSACIVIIDDDVAVGSSLDSVLATYGYATRCFTSAPAAIDALPDIAADCILLDVRMPDLDGLTALKIIQSLGDCPPVIMITGHADVPMAVQAMKLGAADFIEKPVDDETLVASIRSALERSNREAGEATLARAARAGWKKQRWLVTCAESGWTREAGYSGEVLTDSISTLPAPR